MKQTIQNESSFTITSNFDAPINIKNEFLYYVKRVFIDIFIGIPVLILAFFLLLFKKQIKKRSSKKIILGTVPIIIFKTYNDVLKKEFNTTLFVLKDWSEGNFHNGITLNDISTSFIAKRPFTLGTYFAFIWSILNFELFFLYFNSGFLERTIWWRLEPIIYQLFDKKVVLFPYGSDVWTVDKMSNLKKKYALTLFDKKYFDMDFKRIKRNIWWSKYVNAIFTLIDFIKFLPRFDILTLHGHILLDIEENPIFIKKDKIKIVHFANDEFRKGTKNISLILENLSKERDDFEYEILVSISRDTLLKKCEEADIIIDTFIDGFLQYTTLEAAIKGKVVLANLDNDLNDFFKYINNEYYEKHFKQMPIINYNIYNLEVKLLELLNNKEEIVEISKNTYNFTLNIIEENKKFIINFTNKLLEKRY